MVWYGVRWVDRVVGSRVVGSWSLLLYVFVVIGVWCGGGGFVLRKFMDKSMFLVFCRILVEYGLGWKDVCGDVVGVGVLIGWFFSFVVFVFVIKFGGFLGVVVCFVSLVW